MAFGKEKRMRKRSTEVIAAALDSGKPFTYLQSHMDEWNELIVSDFMWLVRAHGPVYLTSHELVDMYESFAGIDNQDVARILRNKLASKESNEPSL